MSQNGDFNGAPPWRPGLVAPRHANARDLRPDRAEVEECRRLLDVEPASDSLTILWEGMGWDPELMCWTDPVSLNAMARVVETYPVRTAAELALVRDRELEVG